MADLKPLSPHALGVLKRLARGPVPNSEVNPGVFDRLRREDLVETVELPSPFATHKGRRIWHLKLTAAGEARAALGEA